MADYRRSTLWIAAALLGAVFIVYAPALPAGFIWDDDAHVTPAALRSWHGLGRIWTEVGATQQYYPILHSAFWLEHRVWGGAPGGYHVANILLHGITSVLVALLLRRLAMRGAVLAAFAFALHPVHVESVAWISEQKNTLSGIFYLGAALSYLRFDAQRDRRRYILASVLFLLGLSAKTVTATLPAALLVIFWWQRGRLLWRRDICPLLPWLLIGAVAGLFTAWVERRIIGAEGVAFDLSWPERSLLAGRVVWFYLGKLFWPANLTFIYPRWAIDSTSFVHWMPLVGLLGILAVFWRLRGRTRAPLATALLFLGALFPVLGFFNVYPFQYSFVADHFQYLASIPVIAAATSAAALAMPGVTGFWRHRARVPGVLLIAGLGVLTWRQAHVYHDNETVFRATIARNPECWMAYNNLGKVLITDRARLPEALVLLERAIVLRPDYPEAHNNLGLALTQSGRPGDAIPHLEMSLRLKPNSFRTHNNFGIALAGSGRVEDALRAFERAAALNPALPNIHENWARALVLLGRNAEAEERFAVAARLRHNVPAGKAVNDPKNDR
jgi:protein O-mannosyl-transferase